MVKQVDHYIDKFGHLLKLGIFHLPIRTWDSTVGIATGYGLDNKRGQSSSPGRVKNFLHVAQTGSGAHPASFPMDIGGSFSRGKAAEA
jgi:hypothetical protein